MATQNPNQTPSSSQDAQRRNTSFESDTQRSSQQPSRSESTGSGAGNVGTDQRSSSMPGGTSQSERRSDLSESERKDRS